jgi:hypothetical protein
MGYASDSHVLNHRHSHHVLCVTRLLLYLRPLLLPLSLVRLKTNFADACRGLQAVPAFILLIAITPFPFSPRWLASKGRYEEALVILADIHGRGDKSDPTVRAEYKDVCQAAEEAKGVRWHMMFGRKMWRRTFVGCFTQIWQQLTGGNVIMYYTVTYSVRPLIPGVCILHGRLDGKCQSHFEFDSICYLCRHECSSHDIH